MLKSFVYMIKYILEGMCEGSMLGKIILQVKKAMFGLKKLIIGLRVFIMVLYYINPIIQFLQTMLLDYLHIIINSFPFIASKFQMTGITMFFCSCSIELKS